MTNKNMRAAANMPRMKHKEEDPFDIMKSKAAEWLINQPEIRQMVFDLARSSKAIVYDKGTNTWIGVER
jgi:hypothetical protein